MFQRIGEQLKNASLPNRYALIILVWLVLFGFYGLIAWKVLSWPIFSSPDEMANFAFSRQFERTSQVFIPTDLPGAPRSVLNDGQNLVPGSFVFFPAMLGFIGKFFGNFGIILLGPALAALVVIFWWHLMKKILAHKAGVWLSTIIFASFPIFWFYSSKSTWQNGIFTSLLIVGIYFLTVMLKQKWWPVAVFTGLIWGIAIAIRPSEIAWLVPGLIAFWAFFRKSFSIKQILLALISALIPVLALFALQYQTYGKSTSFGYRSYGIFEPAPVVRSLSVFQKTKNIFFPFGTKPDVAWKNFINYGYNNLSYLVLPGLLSLLLGFLVCKSKAVRKILISGFVGAFFLFLLYGNYKFIEYPAVGSPVLDSSYLRYWLPLYIFLIFGLSLTIDWLLSRKISKYFGYLFSLSILAISLFIIFQNNEVGLLKIWPRIEDWQQTSKWLVENTPANAVIMAGPNDKIIFPRRHCIGFNWTIPKSDQLLNIDTKKIPVFMILNNSGQIQTAERNLAGYSLQTLDVGPNGQVLVRISAL